MNASLERLQVYLEEERKNLTAEILKSDLQYKDRVAALLHDAGIFSTMGRRHKK